MIKNLDVIKKSELFAGIEGHDIESMLECLQAREAKYLKNEHVLRAGEPAGFMGLLLEGSAFITQEDFWGNRNIVSKVAPGQLFAEAFACVPETKLNVSVVAARPSSALLISVRRVLSPCGSGCAFHARVIRNLLSDLAAKNLRLNEKLAHMAQRTIRKKLLSYLSSEAIKTGAAFFNIPFNRQQLADYLSVDRSALSNELSKMRAEGILSFEKNRFKLNGGYAPDKGMARFWPEPN